MCKIILQILAITGLLIFSFSCKGQIKGTTKKDQSNKVELIIEKLCEEASRKEFLRKSNANFYNQQLTYKLKIDSISLIKYDSLETLIIANNKISELIDSNLRNLRNQLKNERKHLNGGFEFKFKEVKYQIYIHNDTNLKLDIHHKNDSGRIFRSITLLNKELIENGRRPVMITNAGMYTLKNNPEGLYIEDGKELFPIDTDSSEVLLNFYMHPNGVFYVDSLNVPHVCTTSEFLTLYADSSFRPMLATQSGPMLKIDGEIHPRFNWGSTSRKIRSGVGIYDGLSVFAITRGYSNFYDFATFFTEVFQCDDALFLDGAISKMYHYRISPKDTGGNFGPILSISSNK